MSLRAWLRGRKARRPDDATGDAAAPTNARAAKLAPDADDEQLDQAVRAQDFDPDAGDEDLDPFDPFPTPVQLEITDVFDLHTIAPRDVTRAVEAYLAEAHRRGFRSVRLIHGKGRYVQRANVRSILARTPFVRDWTDAPPAAGGTGATIAHLHPPPEKPL